MLLHVVVTARPVKRHEHAIASLKLVARLQHAVAVLGKGLGHGKGRVVQAQRAEVARLAAALRKDDAVRADNMEGVLELGRADARDNGRRELLQERVALARQPSERGRHLGAKWPPLSGILTHYIRQFCRLKFGI